MFFSNFYFDSRNTHAEMYSGTSGFREIQVEYHWSMGFGSGFLGGDTKRLIGTSSRYYRTTQGVWHLALSCINKKLSPSLLAKDLWKPLGKHHITLPKIHIMMLPLQVKCSVDKSTSLLDIRVGGFPKKDHQNIFFHRLIIMRTLITLSALIS